MRQLAERAIVDGVVKRDRPTSGPADKWAGRSVAVNLAESPLTWLHSRGMISARQFAAGERLRADWERAGFGPRVTMRWESPAPPSRGRRAPAAAIEPGIAQLSAKQRFDGAVAAAGPGLTDILWRVVCAGEGLSAAEKALGWPARGQAGARPGARSGGGLLPDRVISKPRSVGFVDRPQVTLANA